MKRKIIVACGGAVATSTMAAEEIKELCQNHNIPVELIQCRVNRNLYGWCAFDMHHCQSGS